MISYRFVPISSQKGVLFLRHPVGSGSQMHSYCHGIGHHWYLYRTSFPITLETDYMPMRLDVRK